MGNDTLVGATEAAAILGVNRASVLRMALRGELAFRKLHGRTGTFIFRLADVAELRDRRAARTKAPG